MCTKKFSFAGHLELPLRVKDSSQYSCSFYGLLDACALVLTNLILIFSIHSLKWFEMVPKAPTTTSITLHFPHSPYGCYRTLQILVFLNGFFLFKATLESPGIATPLFFHTLSLFTTTTISGLFASITLSHYKQPEKTADIWRCNHWFLRQMTSEKRAQKFHTDDASPPRSGQCI